MRGAHAHDGARVCARDQPGELAVRQDVARGQVQGPARAGAGPAARRTIAGARSGTQVQSRRGSSAGTVSASPRSRRVDPAAHEREVRARGPRGLARAVKVAEAHAHGPGTRPASAAGTSSSPARLAAAIGARRRGGCRRRSGRASRRVRANTPEEERKTKARARVAAAWRASRGAATVLARTCAAGVMPSAPGIGRQRRRVDHDVGAGQVREALGARSASTSSAPCSRARAPASNDRSTAATRHPAARSPAAICPPTKPPAPVTGRRVSSCVELRDAGGVEIRRAPGCGRRSAAPRSTCRRSSRARTMGGWFPAISARSSLSRRLRSAMIWWMRR